MNNRWEAQDWQGVTSQRSRNDAERRSSEALHEHWRTLLEGIDWTHFATLTTRYVISLDQIRRLMTQHSRRWCCYDDQRMFWVAESFRDRGGYHAHCLLKSHLWATDLWKYWVHRYGRARVEIFNPNIGASGYVTKYVTKEIADYDYYISSMQTPVIPIRKGQRP